MRKAPKRGHIEQPLAVIKRMNRILDFLFSHSPDETEKAQFRPKAGKKRDLCKKYDFAGLKLKGWHALRVLIVTQYFWPENFRINDLVLGLKKRVKQLLYRSEVVEWWQKKKCLINVYFKGSI